MQAGRTDRQTDSSLDDTKQQHTVNGGCLEGFNADDNSIKEPQQPVGDV